MPLVDNNVQDIDLSVTRKKTFRIDGDDSRILALNTSDMGIFARLKEKYPKLRKLSQQAAVSLEDVEAKEDQDVTDEDTSIPALDALAKLSDIDKQMRQELDYIFDAPVSEVCAPEGTLYDPFNGKLRFEHIIDVLTGLYENNLNAEFNAMVANVQKHTSKYIKKK